jgi:hypothetical protein
VLGGNEWDYPLYGERLERRLTEFPSVSSAARSDPRWLLLGAGFSAPHSADWTSRRLPNGWTLVSRESTRTIAISSGG